MEQVNIIGIDLAKRSFQLHGARADGWLRSAGRLVGRSFCTFSPHYRAALWRWRPVRVLTIGAERLCSSAMM